MILFKNLIYLDALLLGGLFLFREALQRPHRQLINAKIFMIAATTPAVALFGVNIWVLYLYLFAAAAFLPRTRAEACSIYLLLLPSVPLIGTRLSAVELDLSTLLFMNLGGLAGVMIWPGPIARRRIGLDIAVLLLILLFTVMEGRGASSSHWARMLGLNLMLYGAPYLIVSSAMVFERHLMRSLITFAAGGFAIAAVGSFEALRSWSLYQTFHASLGVPLPMLPMDLNVRGGFLRAPGPFLDPTGLGLFLAALMVLLICIRRAFRPQLFLALMGITVLGLLATQSRGAWVAAIAGYLAIACFRGRSLTMVTSAAAGMLLVVAAGIALPAYEEPVTPNLWGQPESTTDYRARLLSRGAEEFMESPVTGFSKDEVRVRLVDLTQGQGIIDFVNSHLYVALVTGTLGLIIWFGYLLAPIVTLCINRRLLMRRKLADIGAAVVGVNVVTSTALVFTSIFDRNCVWMLVFAGFVPVLLNGRKQPKLVIAVPASAAGELVNVAAVASPSTQGSISPAR